MNLIAKLKSLQNNQGFKKYYKNTSWQWYIAENLQHIATIRLCVGALINIVLNFLWIESYGVIGAVYATLISPGKNTLIVGYIKI